MIQKQPKNYGRKDPKFKYDSCYLRAEMDSVHPQTLFIELNAALTFKYEPEYLKLTNVLNHIQNIFDDIKKESKKEIFSFLNTDYFPKALHKDAIVITNEIDSARSYYYNKIKKGQPINIKIGFYLHTANCMNKKSVMFKFFQEDEQLQNDATNYLTELFDKIANSNALTNSYFFTSKIIAEKIARK